jgi:hypothetical protein
MKMINNPNEIGIIGLCTGQKNFRHSRESGNPHVNDVPIAKVESPPV